MKMVAGVLKAAVLGALLALPIIYAGEECSGIPILGGESGTVVSITKEELSKEGDTSYDAAENAIVLAHGADKFGVVKFGSVVQKLGISRFDFGLEFGFRIKSDKNGNGYGFILSYGGDKDCVIDRIENREGRLFGAASEQFCHGVSFAAWEDGSFKGIFLLVNGEVILSFAESEDLPVFDKWNCITMQVFPPANDAELGRIGFYFNGALLGRQIHYRSNDLEGDGNQIFAFGSTAKATGDVNIEMRDIQFKTTRDISSSSLNMAHHIEEEFEHLPFSVAAGFMLVAVGGIVAKLVYNRRKAQYIPLASC